MSKNKGRIGGALKRGTLRMFGTTRPKQAPTTLARVEPPAPAPRSRVNDGDIYACLAPEILDAAWQREGGRPRRREIPATVVTGVGGDRLVYEAHLPSWARQALGSMDEKIARPIGEMRRFVLKCHGMPVPRREWETPQYERRHHDAMADTSETLRRIRVGDVDGAKQLILAGAFRASSPEITGMIPTVPSEVEQDPTA